MGQDLIGGPLLLIGAGMQLSGQQIGGQRGDARRRCGK